MNVFVLCTGRCGSVTFAQACSEITNYTCAHESRTALIGAERLSFPRNHIEVDNRLAWYLGRLEDAFGDDAYYVHLRRDPELVAQSFRRRFHKHIMSAYAHGILHGPIEHLEPLDICRDYCQTVTRNISLFLKNKTRVLDFEVPQAKRIFPIFWRWIQAQGNLPAALKHWDVGYNSSAGSLPAITASDRDNATG